MPKRISKFVLVPHFLDARSNRQSLVPAGWTRHFGEDEDRNLCAWIEVDTEKLEPVQRLIVLSTDEDIPDDVIYLASTKDSFENIWHLFGGLV